MSDSVDNQFAGHVAVAYGQHSPGYPLQNAGQEAAQDVAGQVNVDNGDAGDGIAGQGDSAAATAPAPAGQVAKDPPHRPDDAEPFQCVSEKPPFLCSQHTDTTAGYH